MRPEIGEVQHTQLDQKESHFGDDGGTVVLDLRGSKGAGRIRILFVKEGERFRVTGGTLTMEDGRTHALSGTGGDDRQNRPPGRGLRLSAEDLSPIKARILLMLALTRTTDGAELQRMFTEY